MPQESRALRTGRWLNLFLLFLPLLLTQLGYVTLLRRAYAPRWAAQAPPESHALVPVGLAAAGSVLAIAAWYLPRALDRALARALGEGETARQLRLQACLLVAGSLSTAITVAGFAAALAARSAGVCAPFAAAGIGLTLWKANPLKYRLEPGRDVHWQSR